MYYYLIYHILRNIFDCEESTMKKMSESPTQADTHAPGFQDWARFVAFQPRLYFRPQNLDELKGFLMGFPARRLQTEEPARAGQPAFML